MDRAFYSPVLAFVDNATRPVVATYEGALRRVANDTSALSEAAWSAAAGAVGSVAASAAWVDAQIEERTHWRAVAHAMQQQARRARGSHEARTRLSRGAHEARDARDGA
eukprot:500637-Pleurochrysis_carterae.AAC.1